MVKIRHGIVVNMLHHGSAITEYTVKLEKGVKWICLRPQRKLSVLEFDGKKEGFENTPTILFGRSKATCYRDEKGRIWYSNLVDENDIYYRTLHDIPWFINKLKERQEVFESCKKHMSMIAKLIKNGEINNRDFCIQQIQKWKEFNSSLFPYMFLALMTDELIIENFANLMSQTSNKVLSSKILYDLLKSEYSKNAIKKGKLARVSKNFIFPPEPIFVLEGKIRFDLHSNFESEYLDILMTQSHGNVGSTIDLFNRFKFIAPIVFQLSEENFFVMRAFSIIINHLLDKVADAFLSLNILSNKYQILDYTVDQLATFAFSNLDKSLN